MKKLLFGSLITFITVIASPGIAAEVSPSNLVFQGYQGRLLEEGIPSYATFLQAVYLGKVDAKTLVQGAIAQGKLDPEIVKDESYLRKVKSALFLLRANGSSR